MKKVLQFKIELAYLDPLIWRRIQVPYMSTFYDLHLAIQDSMGWENDHMHMFEFKKTRARPMLMLGVPSEELEINDEMDVYLKDTFTRRGNKVMYEYDFGDCWEHVLLFEGLHPIESDFCYPRCLAGERACPPEDCGGIGGYVHRLEILADKTHEDYGENSEWMGEDFDPNAFDPNQVTFPHFED